MYAGLIFSLKYLDSKILVVFAVVTLACGMYVATQDIEKADEVRTVLKDLWDLRQAKLRRSVMGFIESGLLQAKLNNAQVTNLTLDLAVTLTTHLTSPSP